MTAHSQNLTALAIAYRDRQAAQDRLRRAKMRGDTQAQKRALDRLREATERALRLEARL